MNLCIQSICKSKGICYMSIIEIFQPKTHKNTIFYYRIQNISRRLQYIYVLFKPCNSNVYSPKGYKNKPIHAYPKSGILLVQTVVKVCKYVCFFLSTVTTVTTISTSIVLYERLKPWQTCLSFNDALTPWSSA